MTIHVIVRAAGERTADFCYRELARQTSVESVDRVELTPFWRTLREGLERGGRSGVPWVLSVDADVIPAEDVVARVMKWIDAAHDDIGVLSGMIQDKFMGGIRFGGIRVYRATVIPEMLALMPAQGENVRPESSAIGRLRERGWKHQTIPELVGLHDYEQYYRDIYRKAFLHMQKHGARAARLLDLWKSESVHDDDFRAALAGAADALLWRDDVDCDASHEAFRGEETLSRIGLVEKSEFDVDYSSYRETVQELRCALDAGKIAPVSPTEQHAFDLAQSEEELLQRVHRVGAAFKELAAVSPRVRSAVLHQARRALPDEAILDTFSVGELTRYAGGRLRRLLKP